MRAAEVSIMSDIINSDYYIIVILTVGSYSINYNHDLLNKNMNADMTNPNVYNGIDSLKEEHVYDEIKQKEGYKDPGKSSVCH